MMEVPPTWIDAGLAYAWQAGHPVRHDRTDRWFVYLHESHAAFVVLSGNAGHGSYGGDDCSYSASEIASAIERWGTPVAGLEACPAFFEALDRNLEHAGDRGTRLDIIRAKYLLDAMRARAAIAQAEDALPFTGYGQRLPADEADAATLIIPGEANHDG